MEARRPIDCNWDSKRMRQFLRDIVLFVIANDDSLDEDAKARVGSLRMRESENGEFAAQVGLYILRELRRVRIRNPDLEARNRDFVESLRIVNYTKDEFFGNFELLEDYVSALCRAVLKAKDAGMYLYYLRSICELCCKFAELEEQENYIGYVLRRTGHYLNVYRGAFPGFEALFDFAKEELKNMSAW